MKESQTPVLSVCIPTYNHVGYVLETVRAMLDAFPQDAVEVVVSDNASTDGTADALASVGDRRLKVFRNERNVGSGENWLRVLERASGRYAMLWLDREIFDGRFASRAVECLGRAEVAVGKFLPGLTELGDRDIREIGGQLRVLRSYGMRIGHPTGYFFRVEVLRRLRLTERLRGEDESLRTFLPESLITAMSGEGSFAEIRIPLVVYRLPPFDDLPRSYTYNVGNYWFSPERLFAYFMTYLGYLRETTALSLRQRWLLLRHLLKGIHAHCVDRYLEILRNGRICDYYGLPPEVREAESRRDLEGLFRRMLLSCRPGSLLEKLTLLSAYPSCRRS